MVEDIQDREMMGAYLFHRGVGMVFRICREDEGLSLEDVCQRINRCWFTENPDGDRADLTSYELEALECGHRNCVPIYFWYRLFGCIDRKLSAAIELIEAPAFLEGVRSSLEHKKSGRIDQADIREFLRCPTASQ